MEAIFGFESPTGVAVKEPLVRFNSVKVKFLPTTGSETIRTCTAVRTKQNCNRKKRFSLISTM